MSSTRIRKIAGRLLTITLAGLLALVCAELVVRYLVGYPPRPETRIFLVNDKLGEFGRIHWNAPGSSFWNVEAGNKVFAYNNFGLPGMDVRPSADNRNIFLLGSSWVEALQMPPRFAASSVLQTLLDENRGEMTVYNLGSSGADPYVAWFRSRFFEKYFAPSYVILVLESFHTRWLARHPHPLDFTIPSSFGTEEYRTGVRKFLSRVRAISSFANLIENGRDVNRNDQILDPRLLPNGQNPAVVEEQMSDNLKVCLQQFHNTYAERFLLVSVINDSAKNGQLEEFCANESIRLVTAPSLSRPENRFNGSGHLDERGNDQLGRILYDAILKSDQGQ